MQQHYDKDDIKSRIDCRDLARRYLGDPARHTARYDMYSNPFDPENTPSFAVYADGFRNYGKNGGSWDAIAFIERYEGVDFKEALRIAAAEAGVAPQMGKARRKRAKPPKPPKPQIVPPSEEWQRAAEAALKRAQAHLWSWEGRHVLAYLREKRGLTDETIRAAGFGYNPGWTDFGDKRIAPGILIPWYWDGILWAIKIRQRVDSFAQFLGCPPDKVRGNELDKYGSIPGSKPTGTIYGLKPIAPDCRLLIVEGEFDSNIAQQALDDSWTVATFGGANSEPAPEQLAHLKAASEIILLFDNDAAGKSATTKDAILKAYPHSRVGQYPDGVKDATEFVTARGNLPQLLDDILATPQKPILEDDPHRPTPHKLPKIRAKLEIVPAAPRWTSAPIFPQGLQLAVIALFGKKFHDLLQKIHTAIHEGRLDSRHPLTYAQLAQAACITPKEAQWLVQKSFIRPNESVALPSFFRTFPDIDKEIDSIYQEISGKNPGRPQKHFQIVPGDMARLYLREPLIRHYAESLWDRRSLIQLDDSYRDEELFPVMHDLSPDEFAALNALVADCQTDDDKATTRKIHEAYHGNGCHWKGIKYLLQDESPGDLIPPEWTEAEWRANRFRQMWEANPDGRFRRADTARLLACTPRQLDKVYRDAGLQPIGESQWQSVPIPSTTPDAMKRAIYRAQADHRGKAILLHTAGEGERFSMKESPLNEIIEQAAGRPLYVKLRVPSRFKPVEESENPEILTPDEPIEISEPVEASSIENSAHESPEHTPKPRRDFLTQWAIVFLQRHGYAFERGMFFKGKFQMKVEPDFLWTRIKWEIRDRMNREKRAA